MIVKQWSSHCNFYSHNGSTLQLLFQQEKSMVGESTTHLNHSSPVGLLAQFHTQVLHSNAAAGILRGSYQL